MKRTAALLGDATHSTPRFLAKYWADRGTPVSFVTSQNAEPVAPGVAFVSPAAYESPIHRRLVPYARRLLLGMERAAQQFSRWRGKRSDNPDVWLPFVTTSLVNAGPIVSSVQALKPTFVFGNEVSVYGLATALCRGVPRFLLPWGGDIYHYADASPLLFALTKYALHNVDLVLPGSVSAAKYICDRFDVPGSRVLGLTWGVDRRQFHPASHDERAEICAKWGIDPARTIVLNMRRLRVEWGSSIALAAFIQLATEDPQTHFLLLGGEGTNEQVAMARQRLAKLDLLRRFTILDGGEAPLNTVTDLMRIADVFTSLLGVGDMRSWSVLQATACGGVPVVADFDEHRQMESLGFHALFVDPNDVSAVHAALRYCLDHPEFRAEVRAANLRYIADYEDETVQMATMWDAMMTICARYERDGVTPR